MNAKALRSLSAALLVTSLGSPVIAQPLGEHPAVVVARTWHQKGIDPNTFIVAPPASTQWVSEAPKTVNEPAHASDSPKLHWSAAIGTGHAAGTIETRHNGTGSVEANAAATRFSAPHWTASIGTGTATTSRSAAPDTNAPLSSGTQPIVVATHWTSRIGSGHPFASASPVKYTSVANTR